MAGKNDPVRLILAGVEVTGCSNLERHIHAAAHTYDYAMLVLSLEQEARLSG